MQIYQPFRIVLFGHRDFAYHNLIEKPLYTLLKEIISKKAFTEIYIGRNGEFDCYAAIIIKHLQNVIGKHNNELICVLPYPEKDMEYYEKYYDHVIIPEAIGRTYPKGALIKRNRWMVQQADLFICYVERKEGGAYSALKYARKLGKQIVNLAENNI